MNFSKPYFLVFLILLVVEALIGYGLKGGFIRHTFGDFLIVILMYCFIKAFFPIRPLTASIMVLLIAYSIEFLQLFKVLEKIGLDHSRLANIILGSTFHMSDLLAYTLGVLTILIVEIKFLKHTI